MKKTAIVEIPKILSIIDFNSKYNKAISNGYIDTARNLGLISIKKY